jgi:hypothetical protein
MKEPLKDASAVSKYEYDFHRRTSTKSRSNSLGPVSEVDRHISQSGLVLETELALWTIRSQNPKARLLSLWSSIAMPCPYGQARTNEAARRSLVELRR